MTKGEMAFMELIARCLKSGYDGACARGGQWKCVKSLVKAGLIEFVDFGIRDDDVGREAAIYSFTDAGRALDVLADVGKP